jgi:hypothetical protein
VSENTGASVVSAVTHLIEGFSAEELSTLCYLLATVEDQFQKWRGIISGNDYEPVLFIATVLPIIRNLVSTAEVQTDDFLSDLILALLGFKTNHTDVQGFDAVLARGYMVERVLTGGNGGENADKQRLRYLRWLNKSHVALSRHAAMLRQQKRRYSHEYLKALVAADLPVPLGAGAL